VALSACEAVRDTAKNLSDRNVAWQFFNRREIDEIFRCAETRLADAFAIYNVSLAALICFRYT